MIKRKLLLAMFFILAYAAVMAQSPQKFNYQAVVRDNLGNIVVSQPVTFLITIRDGAPGGTDVYHETHVTTTNQFGLVNIEVGDGTLQAGTFSAINWGSGAKYLDVQLDLGAGMVAVGAPQLISVPYALYANDANVAGTPGPTGPIGPTGADGTDGADGAIGPVGPMGPTGADGTDGADGAIGPVGPIGPTGADGTDGADGAIGPVGPIGPTGNTGAVGPTGLQGVTGITGPLVAGTSGQTLRHDGTSWVANNTLYNSGTNIGIGTSTPTHTLELWNSTATNSLNGVEQVYTYGANFSNAIIGFSNNTGNATPGTTYAFGSVAGFDNVGGDKDYGVRGHVTTSSFNGSAVIGTYGADPLAPTTMGILGTSTYSGIFSGAKFGLPRLAADPAGVNGDVYYNTATNKFRVYENGAWVDMVMLPSATAWSLLGNAGTVDGTNFIGTTDNIPFNIRVNNQKAGRIDGGTPHSAFYGYVAGNSNLAGGTNNTAMGDSALYSNTSGDYNTAYGTNALSSITTSGYNTAVGSFSLAENTAGYNSAVGMRSLQSNTIGTNNTATGYSSLRYNISGINNTACGSNSLGTNDSGSYNVAIGCYSTYTNKSGRYNTAVGTYSLYANSDGEYNTATGYYSLYGNTLGDKNTANGWYALRSNSAGSRNTAVGDSALYNNTVGSWNTAIGARANVSSTGLTNATAIGANATVSASNCLILGNNANVGIGISNPSTARLVVESGGTNTAIGGNYSATRFGQLGTTSYGVYGQYDANIMGYLGSVNYGAYGRYDGDRYGFLGGINYSVFGYRSTVGSRTAYFEHAGAPSVQTDQWALEAYNMNSSANDGSSYAYGGTSGGLMGNNNWTGMYAFGVAGYAYNDDTRCGGVIGSHSVGTYWGSLGYKSSAAIFYGVYGSTAYGSGAGFSPDGNIQTGIGGGFSGGIMGAWAHGNVLGFTSMGELYASYNIGDVYSTGVSANIVSNNGERTAVYSMTSGEVKVYADGTATLIGGEASITFPENFTKVISAEKRPNVVVTPMGESNGLYIARIDKNGFTVKENNGGHSNLEFNWMATGFRVDVAQTPVLPADLADPKFDQNMQDVMFDENNPDRSGTPVWWDGSKLRFDKIPEVKTERKPEDLKPLENNK